MDALDTQTIQPQLPACHNIDTASPPLATDTAVVLL
jgi:hypothetical protein